MVALDSSYFPGRLDHLMLDVGPGTGFLAKIYSRERRVVAVEYDELLAREVGQRAEADRLSACRGDAHCLPIRDVSVDSVIALEVLEHVNDPDAVLREAWRVLKPGGALCVAVPTSYTEHVYSRLHPRYLSNATHVRIFSKRDLDTRIARVGFRDLSTVTEHFEPAICWLLHSALRTNADATGRVLDHHWVDPMVTRWIARVERTRGISRALHHTRGKVGKSWYVYARKVTKDRDARQPDLGVGSRHSRSSAPPASSGSL